MACPNCRSDKLWEDNLHWGCEDCGWSSLAGLNPTRTPSNPHDRHEVAQRPRDYDRLQAERAEEARRWAEAREGLRERDEENGIFWADGE